jgi:hypothetical protein
LAFNGTLRLAAGFDIYQGRMELRRDNQRSDIGSHADPADDYAHDRGLLAMKRRIVCCRHHGFSLVSVIGGRDANNQCALAALACEPIPPTSRGIVLATWNLDVTHTTYQLQFERMHSAVAHVQGPLRITMNSVTMTYADSGEMFFDAGGLSGCLQSW